MREGQSLRRSCFPLAAQGKGTRARQPGLGAALPVEGRAVPLPAPLGIVSLLLSSLRGATGEQELAQRRQDRRVVAGVPLSLAVHILEGEQGRLWSLNCLVNVAGLQHGGAYQLAVPPFPRTNDLHQLS